METIRQQKIARLIQKELAEIFIKDVKDLFLNAMITVTRVRISSDLSIAKIYISIFTVNKKESVFDDIQIYSSEIRKHLGNRIAKQVRVIPELNFFIDDSLDYIEKIDNALKS